MKLEDQIRRGAEEFERQAKSIGILLAIFCLLYFVELASFSLSIDEEIALFGGQGPAWIMQGRWGAYLVETFILTRPVLPFLPNLVFGLACVASYLLILRLARPGKPLGFAEYVSFAVFCGFPTWFFISEFYTNIGAVGIALLCATLAIGLALRAISGMGGKSAGFALALVLGAFSISIYQTFLLYMFALSLGLVFLLPERFQRSDVRRFGALVLVMAGATIVYLAVDKAFKWSFSLPSAYIGSFFDPFYLLSNFPAAVARLLREVRGVYGFSSQYYTVLMWAVPILIAAGLAALAVRSGNWGKNRRIAVLVAAGLILVVPFALGPFGQVQLPIRALVAAPFVVWLFTYLGLSSGNARVKLVSTVAVFLAMFQFLTLQNTTQALNALVAKSDLLLATSLHERFTQLPDFNNQAVYALAIFGGHHYPAPYRAPASSTVGASFFGWDGGNHFRITRYLNALGLSQVRPATEEEIDGAVMQLSRMPVWPARDSVALSDGVLLVRLGEQPNQFDEAAMAAAQKQKP